MQFIKAARRLMCTAAPTPIRRVIIAKDHQRSLMLVTLRDGNRTLFNVSIEKEAELRNGLSLIASYYYKMRKVKAVRGIATANHPPLPSLIHGKTSDKIILRLPNSQAWQTGHILQIDNQDFVTQVNPPRILRLRLPQTCLFIGYTLCPNISIDYANVSESKFEWFSSRQNKGQKSWHKVGDQIHYKIQPTDLGQRLKLRCTPRYNDIQGDPVDTVSTLPVSYGPETCLFHKRHQYTSAKLDVLGDMRIVSYNILSSGYGNEIFNYCNPQYLQNSYRLALLIEELIGYNADIICLQECDQDILHKILLPSLRTHGFACNYMAKKADVKEGLAILFNRKKFQLMSMHNVTLREVLVKDKILQPIYKQIKKYPQLKRKCTTLGNVATASVLRWRDAPSKLFCISNIHLYSNPKIPEVRLIQTATMLQQLDRIRDQYAGNFPVILCGDFNSTPDSNVYQLLTNKGNNQSYSLPVTQDRWNEINLMLKNNFDFHSLYGLPEYTNYVANFVGTIDYILGEKEYLDVKQVVPMPVEEEIKKDTALPSPRAPSDHLALVCDVTMKHVKK